MAAPVSITSYLDDIFIQNSSVTTGAGLASLTYQSSGLAWYYKRQGASSWTQVTLADMTLGTWGSGGFKEADAVHAAGVYEIGVPDAAIAYAAGVHWVDMSIYGATNAAPVIKRIDLDLLYRRPVDIVSYLLDQVNTGATFNVNNSVGKQIRQAAGNVPISLRDGTCQTGSTSTTVKLDSGAPATNNLFIDCIIELTGGTGAGQTATIIAYNGATKVCTVNKPWVTIPVGASTTFSIRGASSSLVSYEGTAVSGGVNTVVLPSDASAVNGFYVGSFFATIGGTGVGQTAPICTGYVGGTRTATMGDNWATPPDGTSIMAVIPTGAQASDTTNAPTVAEIAAAILATPSQLIATDASGQVTAGAIATDAISAAAVSAAAVTKIQAGIAAGGALTPAQQAQIDEIQTSTRATVNAS